MSSIKVSTRAGETHVVAAQPGLSLMEIIRDHGIDGLLAVCGGCCSCSTCHIYVDPAAADRLPAIGRDEDELLDSSSFRTDRSRLACQVPFSIALDKVAVTIAPED